MVAMLYIFDMWDGTLPVYASAFIVELVTDDTGEKYVNIIKPDMNRSVLLYFRKVVFNYIAQSLIVPSRIVSVTT